LNNSKKGIKKRRKRGIWVKIICRQYLVYRELHRWYSIYAELWSWYLVYSWYFGYEWAIWLVLSQQR